MKSAANSFHLTPAFSPALSFFHSMLACFMPPPRRLLLLLLLLLFDRLLLLDPRRLFFKHVLGDVLRFPYTHLPPSISAPPRMRRERDLLRLRGERDLRLREADRRFVFRHRLGDTLRLPYTHLPPPAPPPRRRRPLRERDLLRRLRERDLLRLLRRRFVFRQRLGEILRLPYTHLPPPRDDSAPPEKLHDDTSSRSSAWDMVWNVGGL